MGILLAERWRKEMKRERGNDRLLEGSFAWGQSPCYPARYVGTSPHDICQTLCKPPLQVTGRAPLGKRFVGFPPNVPTSGVDLPHHQTFTCSSVETLLRARGT